MDSLDMAQCVNGGIEPLASGALTTPIIVATGIIGPRSPSRALPAALSLPRSARRSFCSPVLSARAHRRLRSSPRNQ